MNTTKARILFSALLYRRAVDTKKADMFQVAAEEFGMQGDGGLRSLCLDMATFLRRGQEPRVVKISSTGEYMVTDEHGVPSVSDHQLLAVPFTLKLALVSMRFAMTWGEADGWRRASAAWKEYGDDFLASFCARGAESVEDSFIPTHLAIRHQLEKQEVTALEKLRGKYEWILPHMEALTFPVPFVVSTRLDLIRAMAEEAMANWEKGGVSSEMSKSEVEITIVKEKPVLLLPPAPVSETKLATVPKKKRSRKSRKSRGGNA